jgi:RNA-binding protein
MLSTGMRHRFKREMGSEKATIWIGKNGVDQKIICEINNQLDKKKIVKIKILQTALENEKVENIVSKAERETASTLIEVRGHTFALYRRKKTQKTPE